MLLLHVASGTSSRPDHEYKIPKQWNILMALLKSELRRQRDASVSDVIKRGAVLGRSVGV